MKRILTAVMVTLALGRTNAVAKSMDNEQSVTVYIRGGADMPTPTLAIAKGIAGEMFAKVGVHVVWKAGQPKRETASQTIVVDIKSDVTASFHPGPLAYAQEFEGVHITVFYDRVESVVSREILPKLLAHVLVHEITHILEGVDRHSPEGVMKAHWSPADIASMAFKPLPFDPSDVRLIQLGIAHRDSSTLAKANPTYNPATSQ